MLSTSVIVSQCLFFLSFNEHYFHEDGLRVFFKKTKKKNKNKWQVKKVTKVKNMEMWELLKSLFSEVNFSFWNAAVVQNPQYSLADTDHTQSRSLELRWAESPVPSRSVKAEEWIPSRAGAAQASLLSSYTSEKPHSWRVNSVWINVRFFFFFFLRGWGTLQLVVMRPTGCRERGGGELRALHMLSIIAVTFQQTQRHRPCKSGWDRFLRPTRHVSPGMSSLLCFSSRAYFERRWGHTTCFSWVHY